MSIDSAKRHNTPLTNMDNRSFAALMASILHWEGRLPGNAKDEDSRLRQDTLPDFGVNSRIISPVAITTGIANISPEVAFQILQGQVPRSDGNLIPICFDYEIIVGTGQYRITYDSVLLESLNRSIGNVIGSYPSSTIPGRNYTSPSQVVFEILQNNMRAGIEFLAANLQRGADRANYYGIQASVFNLATWHNRGVQTLPELLTPTGEQALSYGNTILRSMKEAFEVLFPNEPIGNYLPHNSEEQGFIDQDLRANVP